MNTCMYGKQHDLQNITIQKTYRVLQYDNGKETSYF